jgi:GNAT superfamily N-acetyltransferase
MAVMNASAPLEGEQEDTITFIRIDSSQQFPAGFGRADFVEFLHTHLGKYTDPPEAIEKAIDYAFSSIEGKGGFLLAAFDLEEPVGAMVVNDTGMGGYIPEHILVYVAVDSSKRGQGIGTKFLSALRSSCTGDVALHVEYDNPAKRLYERFGFTSRYAEMRLQGGDHG